MENDKTMEIKPLQSRFVEQAHELSGMYAIVQQDVEDSKFEILDTAYTFDEIVIRKKNRFRFRGLIVHFAHVYALREEVYNPDLDNVGRE